MKINVEKISEVERKLNIEVPWEKYQSEIEQQFSLIRKSATIKGFRKGKAPVGMVRRVYGEEAHKDTVNALASEAMKDAMAQHDLKPFGNPYLTDVKTEENKAVIMEAMIELEPVFDLSEYSGMELEKTVPEASEEEITTLLERF